MEMLATVPLGINNTSDCAVHGVAHWALRQFRLETMGDISPS